MTENYGTFKKINVNLFFLNLSENQTLNIKEMLNDQMLKKQILSTDFNNPMLFQLIFRYKDVIVVTV